jgi:hypothetical protein
VLGYDHTKDAANIGMTMMAPYEASSHKTLLNPSKGDPLLLVLPITPDASADPSLPLIKVETALGPLDKKGIPQPYDRLVINSRAKEGHFKVLLIPFHMGEPMPSVSYDAKTSTATVAWGDQKETLTFDQGSNGKTAVTINRDGKQVVAANH